MRKLLLLTILACGFASSVTAQVYKWKDDDGRTHYSNLQPPAFAKILEQKKLGDSDENNLSPLTINKIAKKNTILLYISAACGDPCVKAQALLDQRGVTYSLKNTDKDKKAIKNPADLERLPILIAGNQPAYKGLVENDWQHLIDNLGYAKRKFTESGNPASSVSTRPVSTLKPTASKFKCDGRTYCSQMTSCDEAIFFLNNCPGVKMDGGKQDGMPCERQWCGR